MQMIKQAQLDYMIDQINKARQGKPEIFIERSSPGDGWTRYMINIVSGSGVDNFIDAGLTRRECYYALKGILAGLGEHCTQ